MNDDHRVPPYRIETARTVIRCYQPADAPLLATAINESLEHLRRWHPWAMSEPESVDAKAHRLRQMRGRFDLDEDYTYGIFAEDESTLLGSTGLHPRVGPKAFEIGYWVHENHVNQGLATEATKALCVVAFVLCGADRIEIRCDPNNNASARIPQKLGFLHEATLRDRMTTPTGEPCGTMIWTLFAKDFDADQFGANAIKAYDACGNPMLRRSL